MKKRQRIRAKTETMGHMARAAVSMGFAFVFVTAERGGIPADWEATLLPYVLGAGVISFVLGSPQRLISRSLARPMHAVVGALAATTALWAVTTQQYALAGIAVLAALGAGICWRSLSPARPAGRRDPSENRPRNAFDTYHVSIHEAGHDRPRSRVRFRQHQSGIKAAKRPAVAARANEH